MKGFPRDITQRRAGFPQARKRNTDQRSSQLKASIKQNLYFAGTGRIYL